MMLCGSAEDGEGPTMLAAAAAAGVGGSTGVEELLVLLLYATRCCNLSMPSTQLKHSQE
jgi:hypothetical protein